jgi:hypothetical protein
MDSLELRGWLLWTRSWPFAIHRMLGISWLGEQLLVCRIWHTHSFTFHLFSSWFIVWWRRHILRNVGWLSTECTALYRRKQPFLATTISVWRSTRLRTASYVPASTYHRLINKRIGLRCVVCWGFRRNVIPPSSGVKSRPSKHSGYWYLLGLLLDHYVAPNRR